MKIPQLDLEITDPDIKILEKLDGLNFDAQRSEILKSLESIDVQACPGSGKTTLIATKLKLISQKWHYKNRGVCVLSHTNVAKDEIISKIKVSGISEARNLLIYPHFIGTIQEFINRYLGIPYLRSKGIKVNLIDTEQCVELIHSNLTHKTKLYIDKKSQHRNVLFDFNLKMQGTEINMDIPTFKNHSTSFSYNDLKSTREKLIKEGYFFYRDFYIFSEKILTSHPSLSEFIQTRFPLVIIDEMQDTQKFQDDLLQKIFPLNSELTVVQRFGDPDQSIFNGINDEIPNESYNKKSRSDMTFIIDGSHRFDVTICQKIKGLSFNEVNLDTDLSCVDIEKRKKSQSNRNGFKHTVFVYNDETIDQVIPEFAKMISNQFNTNIKKIDSISAKSVGAVGNKIDDDKQLKIGHYWKSFNKSTSRLVLKEELFIEAVYFARKHNKGDASESYKIINDRVLKLLRLANKKDADGGNINSVSLKKILIENKNIRRYRLVIFWLLNPNNSITNNEWGKIYSILIKILRLDISLKKVQDYLEYKKELNQEHIDNTLTQNSPVFDGVKIEISTIHSVKGETHDATLVLETKNHCYDIETMLPYLTGDLPSRENTNTNLRENPSSKAHFKPNQKFMRQLYVAMSRPKHLLCIAIHEDRITEEQKSSLILKGWFVSIIENNIKK